MKPQGIEQEFMHTLRRLGRAHMGNLFQGVTRSEFSVLMSLERYGERHEGEGIRASVLAELVEASPQALSRTLKGLERKGYIVRHPDPRDRRNASICLTEEARGVMEAGKKRMKDLFCQVVEAMGEEEIRELMVRMDRLTEVIRQIDRQTPAREEAAPEGVTDQLEDRTEGQEGDGRC